MLERPAVVGKTGLAGAGDDRRVGATTAIAETVSGDVGDRKVGGGGAREAAMNITGEARVVSAALRTGDGMRAIVGLVPEFGDDSDDDGAATDVAAAIAAASDAFCCCSKTR